MIDLLVPKKKYDKLDHFVLKDAIEAGNLDFPYHSKKSMSSVVHSGHHAHAVTASRKWTWDVGLTKLINAA